jgi:tyrosyl-tRNA synthetase
VNTALDRDFFARPPVVVGPDLLGCVVVNGPVAVQLTEVEAYNGADDPGSHAFRGPTPRNEVMFGPPGHVYVYFTYGMHWCANLVCHPAGRAGAVLLRAGEVSRSRGAGAQPPEATASWPGARPGSPRRWAFGERTTVPTSAPQTTRCTSLPGLPARPSTSAAAHGSVWPTPLTARGGSGSTATPPSRSTGRILRATGRSKVTTVVDILDELKWRGLVALSTDEEALRAAFVAGPVTFYCGFDPTAPSLHFGNLLQLLTVRRLQDAGHRPLVLVGGSTGLVGDPKATAERVLQSKATIADWVERIRSQVSRYVSFDGDNAARIVNNLDWTAPLSAIDFLRDIGKHYRISRMLAKEAVNARLESQEGISYTEFSYQILQGMDYLELYRRYGCTLQTGGSDQWGNITSGVDLIHRVEGVSVHALATPLLTKADGTKFGKTESGTVWLDPEMTSPYAFYQYWLNVEDALVPTLVRALSFRSHEEIEALERATGERPAAREGQRALAREVTTMVHGAEETAQVEAASRALFGHGVLAELDERTLAAALSETSPARIPVGPDAPSYVDLFVAAGLVQSRSAARRAIAEGGAYVNNDRLDPGTDPDAGPAAEDLLHGRWVVLRRGKRAVSGAELVR